MEYTLHCRLSQRQSRTGSRKIRFAQESCYDPAVKKMKQSLASRRLLVMAYVPLWTVFISITSKQKSVKKTFKPFRSRLGNVQATSKNLQFDWCWEQLVSPQVLKVYVILRHGVDSEVKPQSVFMKGHFREAKLKWLFILLQIINSLLTVKRGTYPITIKSSS